MYAAAGSRAEDESNDTTMAFIQHAASTSAGETAASRREAAAAGKEFRIRLLNPDLQRLERLVLASHDKQAARDATITKADDLLAKPTSATCHVQESAGLDESEPALQRRSMAEMSPRYRELQRNYGALSSPVSTKLVWLF